MSDYAAYCTVCKAAFWPPGARCRTCLGPAILQKITGTGRLVEFSSYMGKYFGIAEFGKVRLLGSLDSARPEIGKMVRICGDGKERRFEILD